MSEMTNIGFNFSVGKDFINTKNKYRNINIFCEWRFVKYYQWIYRYLHIIIYNLR